MFSYELSRSRRLLLLLAIPVFLVSCERIFTPGYETSVQELRGGQYALDKDHAVLLWKVNHLGFSHYIGRFNEFDAVLDFDPENIEGASVEVIVETASLDVNNPSFEEDLRGSGWFDVENHPQAVFRTTSFVEALSEDTFVYRGDLTLLGTTAPVDMTVTFNGGGRNFLTRSYTLGFTASAEFNRSDFGLSQLVRFGIGDNIELEIHVEFLAAD